MVNFFLFMGLSLTSRTLIGYIIVFVVGAIIGGTLYLLHRSNRKPIQLKAPLYPFFESAGRSAESIPDPDVKTTDTSALYACSYNYEDLTPAEFGEMAVQSFKHQGWTNIQAISGSKEEGKTYIGIDETGKLTRVEIHHLSEEIDQPLINKFHTAILKATIQRAIMVTNTDYSEEAVKYAHEVHIELLNGQQFTTQCEDILDKVPRADRLTRSLNRHVIESGVHEFINRAIFSYPKPPSEFLSEIKISKITYSPVEYHHFTLGQQFANPTRTWVWKMNYPDHLLVNLPLKNWHIIENHPRFPPYSLDQQLTELETQGIEYSLLEPLPVNKISQVREKIQEITTIEKIVTDHERRKYPMVCTPDLTSIEVKTSAIYWGSSVGVNSSIGRNNKFQLQLHEGKVSKIVTQNGKGDLHEKTTVLCQECHKLEPQVKYFRKLKFCSACGKILCKECSNFEKGGNLSHIEWCSECWSQIKEGKLPKKRNREIHTEIKRKFHDWQVF